MDMWIVYALLSSICLAIWADLNRVFQMEGFRLIFWRSLFCIAMCMPFALSVEWPEVPDNLYLIAVVAGIYGVGALTVKFDLSARHNGRVASMEMPIKTFVTFVLWLFISEAALNQVQEDIPQTLGVIAMFALAAYALTSMRRNDASWETMFKIIPIGIIAAVLDVFCKVILAGDTPEESFARTTILITIGFITVGVLSGLILFARSGVRNKPKPLLPPNMLKAAFIIGFFTATGYGFFYAALLAAPNPAYVSAMGMLTPVWLLVFHRLSGVKDKASPLMGTLLVLSAIGLILISS